MDGFKTLPKMQHFKEGGGVNNAFCGGGKAKGKYKAGGEVAHKDVKEDKKLIKKAFKMHDAQEHDGEKTDLSKLRKGGRSKKENGTVRKYKTGGSVQNVYEAKKGSGDLDNIKKTKDIKPGKAAAPSKAVQKPALRGSDVEKEKSKAAGSTKAKKVNEKDKKAAAPSGAKETPNKYKKGGAIKKMAAGGPSSDMANLIAQVQKIAGATDQPMSIKGSGVNYANPAMQQALKDQQARQSQMQGQSQVARPATAPAPSAGPVGGGVTPSQWSSGMARQQADINQANKIAAGQAPAQQTPGIMSPAERRASIARAFSNQAAQPAQATQPAAQGATLPQQKRGGKVKGRK